MRNRWYAPGSVHQLVFEFLRSYCRHPEMLVNFGRHYSEKHPTDKADPNILRAGLVTKLQLTSYFGESAGGLGFAVGNELARIYDALVYWDVFTEFPFSQRGLVYDFRVNFMNVDYYESRRVLENIVKGPGILHWRYYPATVAIIVDKRRQETIGSGSVVSHNGKTFVLTNKHVVDPSDDIIIKSFFLAAEEHAAPTSQLILAEGDDLAAFSLSLPESHPRFFLGHESFPLQEVILFGYPKIPLTMRPHLTVHSGEVNARIQIRDGEELYLISNYASPGSSGGPFIDYRGLLIGVVSDSLEAHYEGERSIFQHSAAVPLDRVQRFIESRVLPSLV
jgi:S1-C subfamily serine protease